MQKQSKVTVLCSTIGMNVSKCGNEKSTNSTLRGKNSQ